MANNNRNLLSILPRYLSSITVGINSYSIYLDALRQNFGHMRCSSSIDEAVKSFVTFNLRDNNFPQGAYIKYHIKYLTFYVRACRKLKIHPTRISSRA